MKQFWKTDAVTSWEKMKCTQKSTFYVTVKENRYIRRLKESYEATHAEEYQSPGQGRS